MKRTLTLILVVLLFSLSSFVSNLRAEDEEAAPEPPVRSVADDQRDIINYGTETEIAALIQTLRNERASYLDEELIETANRTRNRNILSGVFGFFGEMEKSGLEERAIRAIRERDDEANETVSAAVDYLGRVRAARAIDVLQELINSGESRFLSSAIRALGRAASGTVSLSVPTVIENDEEEDDAPVGEVLNGIWPNEPFDRVAFFLLDYYNNRNPSDDNRREIITALGETGSSAGLSFLSDIAENPDENAFLRIAALDSIAKITAASDIAGNHGLRAVIDAVSSTDPNVRSAAVAALGPFIGEEVEEAILEAFRDSFWRTRLGAAQAAGQRRMISAIPFLRFRAERDDTPQVRDEAIRALGAINNSETVEILGELFTNRRNSDRVRLMAGEMLLQYQADEYALRVIAEMDEARLRNQTPLYNGFIRILTSAVSSSLETPAGRLLETGGVIERSLALDMVMNNDFHSLEEGVRNLLDEQRNGVSLARKARLTLERLGLE